MGNLTGRSEPEGLSPEEVEKHNNKDDAWMVLFGEVLDVTKFLPIHPGGEESIHMYLGKDATEAWVEIHTPETLERNLHHMTKVGKLQERGGLMSWLMQRISGSRQGPPAATAEESASAEPAPADDEPKKGLQFTEETEQDLQREYGSFTLESLARWDGKQLPMLISICGQVIDVSPSENFVPTHGYGKLWAGKDCTWSMATVSLKAHDTNRMDFKVEELEEMQFNSLAGWLKHFTEKYRSVGVLEEYKNWDFTAVEKAAEELKKPSTD
mmetsp:Transcript_23314/g.42159  ORF Transcript_23314/g.42159 Transcript_23314/m.42159 type:complete len:269 (-) Transcript_23314:41-847(-)|eukprot:CAMPEP_0197664532 /NCGR_PEP_ID=MMETSP1338-20131121/58694_1 /TAXON_ID=43686 ORGANISM="Pelagodinium beii, Strain RCC1491" /NCGR_SAMPLE_ID=MMETSP1338 /ASSEMBLY_ACC=CAM_ASM_000754 /LENGTH=268 /DNA_ID=CAMNT_0043243193 /DNA_START=41 /DNA_END=847 /DNA_ORIENTATION=+